MTTIPKANPTKSTRSNNPRSCPANFEKKFTLGGKQFETKLKEFAYRACKEEVAVRSYCTHVYRCTGGRANGCLAGSW